MLVQMPGTGHRQKLAWMMQMHQMLGLVPQRQVWTGQSHLQKGRFLAGCCQTLSLLS